MPAKGKRGSIVNFFTRKIQSAMTELDTTIYTNIQQIASEHSSRGILSSGMTASAMLKMINDTVLASCKDTLELIPLFQDENNFRLKDDQLDIISNLYSSKYTSYYIDRVKRDCYEIGKRYIGEEIVSGILNQNVINYTTNAIFSMVANKINDVKTFNLVGNENSSVKTAKVNTWVAIW